MSILSPPKTRLQVAASMAALCAFALLLPGQAHADVITNLSNITPDGSGGFDWTYAAFLTDQQYMDPSLGSSQFGTVYDFGPATLVGTTGDLASDFTFSFDPTDTAAFATAPTDTALGNIRFTDVGTFIASSTNLGTFTVNSPFGASKLGMFDGQALKVQNNTVTGNIGMVGVPSALAASLPAALPLFGTGLAVIGLIAWPRSQRDRRLRRR